MLTSQSFITLLSTVTLAFAVPNPNAPHFVPITRRAETTSARPHGYIIKLKPDAPFTLPVSTNALDSVTDDMSTILHEYPDINAFAGVFSPAKISALQNDPNVESIEEDAVGGIDQIIQQTNAPWGLQRISSFTSVNSTSIIPNYKYSYDKRGGIGVDVYVIDSGININHEEFEGRAVWGQTFGGYTPDQDQNGHGTHVAGTAGGKTYGVAKNATLIAVRVLDAGGSGFTSDCVAAVQWVTQQAAITGRASVINISLHFPPNNALDAAVNAAVDAGVHVAVSAGNAATLWNTQSPGRAEKPITVGATDITDTMAWFSNYGAGVDIFAPGASTLSAYIGSNTATATLSGTSMSTPHVAGLIAYHISRSGNLSPADILGLIKEKSPVGNIANIPSGTINQMANNGVELCAPTKKRTSCENIESYWP